MKHVIAAALLLAASILAFESQAQTVWINGEPVMINQIGNTTTIYGSQGVTMCNTVGNMTNCY